MAESEADLDTPADDLCHVYPGPEMSQGQVEWLPCSPAKLGSIILLSTEYRGWLNLLELEIFGY